MKKTVRVVLAVLLVAYMVAHLIPHAHAQSSLGIGSNEATLPSTGLFGPLLNTVNLYQQQFYRSLTAALKAMRTDGSKLWILVGLSFAYGVFHAAGPGHGKAVISAYMLANEVALRRGILLSFISAMLQALTAIVVMTLVFLLLRGTAISMTDATRFLEVASYALITCFGAWLLWRKTAPVVRRLSGGRAAHSLSAAAPGERGAHAHRDAGHAHAHHHHDGHGHGHHGHVHGHTHDHHDHAVGDRLSEGVASASSSSAVASRAAARRDHGHVHHAHSHQEHGDDCGHLHAPDPTMLSGERFDWRTAWSAVVAVGLRPCSGALIVLSFAFLNGLWAGGVLSVLAMAVGTGITVSILATLAVTAKNVAVRLAGADGPVGARIHTAIEIAGAAFVLVVGLLLLSASVMA